jgi:hypothetical protein
VTELAVTRCAAPQIRRTSAYTVLGFAGYGAASLVAAALFVAWQLPLADRLIAAFAPPLAFLAVVRTAQAITGVERIVFYQVAVTAVLAAGLLDLALGSQPARVVDVATAGIGTFLVFGRLGCFAVACCHGRPARFGVVYGAAHVRVGFWARWTGRRLWPTQLVESAVSLALVVAGLAAGWTRPGLPALIYILGYAVLRFALELVRGDSARPQRHGISEAQWTALATALACALWQPSWLTAGAALALALAAAVLAARRQRRELFLPRHLVELDRACTSVTRSGERAETSLGVAVSRHLLPDGRIDWVLSSTHPLWSPSTARRLADLMWPHYELVEGRLPGVAHIVVGAPPGSGSSLRARSRG